MKLFEAPLCSRFNTLTATLDPSLERVPLYTEPKLPEPTRLSGENPPVHFAISEYEICKSKSFVVVDLEAFFLALFTIEIASSEQEKVKNSTRKMVDNSNSPESKVGRYMDSYGS